MRLSLTDYIARQQFIDPVDLVIGDTAENISQPSLRIDAVELCGFDERIGNGVVTVTRLLS